MSVPIDLNIGQILFGVLGALIWLVWNNLKAEITRIEMDARSRSEKNEKQITHVEREHADVLKAVADLKVFLKDTMSSFKLELVKDHPNKEDLRAAISSNASRFEQLERDIRDLVADVMGDNERPSQRRRRTGERA